MSCTAGSKQGDEVNGTTVIIIDNLTATNVTKVGTPGISVMRANQNFHWVGQQLQKVRNDVYRFVIHLWLVMQPGFKLWAEPS